MLDLAKELGVTESRVSQMKAEALDLPREGLDATLDTELQPGGSSSPDRIARRKEAYFAAVAAGSSYRDRLDADPRPLRRRRDGAAHKRLRIMGRETAADTML